MSREQTDNKPHDFHADRALLGHTVFLANGIQASAPARRSPATKPASVGKASAARRFISNLFERHARHDAEGVDATAIEAWAARATAGSGFGGAEAANDATYSSAA